MNMILTMFPIPVMVLSARQLSSRSHDFVNGLRRGGVKMVRDSRLF